jgi:imidazolonepropionase-like amidohydrolase
MRRESLISAAIGLVVCAWTGGAVAQTAFVGATLFDGTGADPVEDAIVVVMGDRIFEVGSRSEVDIPDYMIVVDVGGKWIVPGLIDAHIHYFQSGGLYTRPDVIDLRSWRPHNKEMETIDENLDQTFRRYLASGVTSVVDVGGGYWNFEVRDIANVQLYAPRTAVAGPLVSTVSRPQMDIGDPPIIEVKSPEEARELVRKQLAYAPDLVKIWFIVPRDGNFTPNLPIIEATIDEAHSAGVRVAVHSTQLEAARAAVEMGADVLVHSVDDEMVDDEFVALVQESGAVYTSTLIVREGYSDVLGGNVRMTDVEHELGDPDVVMTWFEVPVGPDSDEVRARRRERLERTMPVMQKNLKAMQDGGAIIAAGTDAGNIGTLHGPAIHREFELMADAGLTPPEILINATRNAALCFAAISWSSTPTHWPTRPTCSAFTRWSKAVWHSTLPIFSRRHPRRSSGARSRPTTRAISRPSSPCMRMTLSFDACQAERSRGTAKKRCVPDTQNGLPRIRSSSAPSPSESCTATGWSITGSSPASSDDRGCGPWPPTR